MWTTEMRNSKFFFIAICFGLVSGRLPEGLFPKCPRDKNLKNCLLEGVETIRPNLIDGIPEVSFPPLEPFTMDSIQLDISKPGMKIRGKATNIEASGAGNFVIEDFNWDKSTMTADLIISIPKLEVTADYNTKDSKLILFNIESTGRFSGSFVDVKAVIHVRGKIDSDNGLEYMRIPYLTVKVEVGKGSSIRIEPNGRLLSKISAKFVNMAPARLLVKMLQSSINKTTAKILKKYINDVFDEMPLQDLIQD